MKHFVLLPNAGKDEAMCSAVKIKEYIEKRGGTARILDDDGTNRAALKSSIPAGTEAVLTLGGDGTLLRAVHDLYGLGLRFLGINLGTLGFLAEAEISDLPETADQLLSDCFTVEERLMLCGEIWRDGQVVYRDVALNDIVIQCSGQTRASQYEFSVNGELLKSCFADGITLSTPTGSTAYNLSCGGPIAMPGSEVILATPVNPHSLAARSLILNRDAEAGIVLNGKEPDTAAVFFDSNVFEGFLKGSLLKVRAADEGMKLIRLGRHSFSGLIRTKLQ